MILSTRDWLSGGESRLIETASVVVVQSVHTRELVDDVNTEEVHSSCEILFVLLVYPTHSYLESC